MGGLTPPAERCAARPDPYAGTTPVVPAETLNCNDHPTAFTIVLRPSLPLRPCVYTGGINIVGSFPVTFAPGVHVIRGGSLNVTMSGGSITANGVTFVLENGATVNLTGSGVTYRFTAPTTGDFAGFVFYQRPTTTTGTSNITGSSSFHFEGAFYLPNQTVNITGTNTITTPSPFTAYIARNFTFTGTGTWAMTYDPPRMTVPVPAGLQTVSGTGTVALVR
jgi:hypothetical protein